MLINSEIQEYLRRLMTEVHSTKVLSIAHTPYSLDLLRCPALRWCRVKVPFALLRRPFRCPCRGPVPAEAQGNAEGL